MAGKQSLELRKWGQEGDGGSLRAYDTLPARTQKDREVEHLSRYFDGVT